jgi:crotonobetainyl-CoA:carnitine CoA-transferase CaiB-like acyl-CoA transferase
MMSEQAFSEVVVLDCTEGISGGYCTKLLADFGASVVKIEKPGIGDISRGMGPFLNDEPDSEKSGTFFYLNTNKKSITLDLETKTGKNIFLKLLEKADVVIENFAPGEMSKLGLSYESLVKTKPQVIMTSITGFGQTGPYRDYKATNLVIFGLSGAMYTSRPATHTSSRPVVEGGQQAEYTTGLLSYVATVAALINKMDTGKGTWIDMSAIECLASTLGANISEYPYLGLSRKTNPFAIHGYPIGYSVPCKDGWISLTPGLGGAPNIPLLIEQPELLENPLFTKPAQRMAEPEKFDELLTPWLKEHGKWEITKQAQELKLAFTPVLSPGELMDDEQLKAKRFFVEAEHPTMGKVTYPGAPFRLSNTPARVGKAPLLGEDNEAIYSALGFSKEDLVILREQGII